MLNCEGFAFKARDLARKLEPSTGYPSSTIGYQRLHIRFSEHGLLQRLLAIFLAVLDAGSFSAAARKPRVPSAVSMAIAQLEAELDLPLFDRATRRPCPPAPPLAPEPQARQVICQLNLLDAQACAHTRAWRNA